MQSCPLLSDLTWQTAICDLGTHFVFSNLTQPSQFHSIPLCASLCLVLNADSETVEMKKGLSLGLQSRTLVVMTDWQRITLTTRPTDYRPAGAPESGTGGDDWLMKDHLDHKTIDWQVLSPLLSTKPTMSKGLIAESSPTQTHCLVDTSRYILNYHSICWCWWLINVRIWQLQSASEWNQEHSLPKMYCLMSKPKVFISATNLSQSILFCRFIGRHNSS